MVLRNLFQCHIRFAVLHRGDKAPTLALSFKYLAASLKIGIQFRQALPEVVDASFEIVVWNKEVLLHVFLLYLVASLTGQDDQLADDVRAAEVNTWVGFRVTLLLGTTYCFREGNVCGNLVEDEVERTRENGLNFQYLITRVAQVVDGTDNRQASPYVGRLAEQHALVASGLS